LATSPSHEVAVPHFGRARGAEEPLEPHAPIAERQRPEVVGAVAQHVEGDERGELRGGFAIDIARAHQVHAPLQALKPGGLPTAVERHDLAVEHDRHAQTLAEILQAADHFRELGRLFVAET